MDIFESKNFAYVENMAWIRLLPTNRLMMEPAPYFARSKLTMLIFKKVVLSSLTCNDFPPMLMLTDCGFFSLFLVTAGLRGHQEPGPATPEELRCVDGLCAAPNNNGS